MKNCFVIKLKGTADNPDLKPFDGLNIKIRLTDSTSARGFNFGSDVAGSCTIKSDGKILFTNENLTEVQSKVYDSSVPDSAYISYHAYEAGHGGTYSDVTISNCSLMTCLDSGDIKANIAELSQCLNLRIFRSRYTSGDIAGFGALKKLEGINIYLSSEVTGSINSLASNLLEGRDIQQYSILTLTCNNKITYYNGSQTITTTSNQVIVIVFKNGGYELHSGTADGALLYDSLG